MPVYKYICSNCGEVLEIYQDANDKPRVRCPKCKKHKLKKDFGSFFITFKGDGFSKKNR